MACRTYAFQQKACHAAACVVTTRLEGGALATADSRRGATAPHARVSPTSDRREALLCLCEEVRLAVKGKGECVNCGRT